jgi:hypothetical protein
VASKRSRRRRPSSLSTGSAGTTGLGACSRSAPSPVSTRTGSIREWVGVHTDISERKSVEAALRASEARLSQERARPHTLVDNLPVGVCFLDRDGKGPSRQPGLPALPAGSAHAFADVGWRRAVAGLGREWTAASARPLPRRQSPAGRGRPRHRVPLPLRGRRGDLDPGERHPSA